jgi:hypothetical protein
VWRQEPSRWAPTLVSDGRVGGVRLGDIPIAGWFISYISIHFMENPTQIKENLEKIRGTLMDWTPSVVFLFKWFGSPVVTMG